MSNTIAFVDSEKHVAVTIPIRYVTAIELSGQSTVVVHTVDEKYTATFGDTADAMDAFANFNKMVISYQSLLERYYENNS